MSESTEAAPSPEPAAKPAKGGKLITILALVNFLALLGLGGYFFYTQQHAAAQPKKADDAHGEKKEAGAHGEGAKAEGEHGKAAEEEEEEEEEKEKPAEGHGKPAEGHGKPAEGHGKAAEGHGAEAAGGGDEHAAGGPLMVLESMVTNLADPDSDRYLKASLSLRITSEAAKAEVEAHLVPVRNQILLYLSSLTIADTSGADNKREIQKKIKRLANEAMPSSRITQVYFTEFVIQ